MNKCIVLDYHNGEVYIIDYSTWEQEDLDTELEQYLDNIDVNINNCHYMFTNTACIRFV